MFIASVLLGIAFMIAFIVLVIIAITCFISQNDINDTIDRYNNDICIGDSKEKVISILGNNFTYSVLILVKFYK